MPAQIALAWLLVQKPWIVPIQGHHENIGPLSIDLSLDDLRDIDGAASKITVQGAGYPEKLEEMTGR
jgi:aryl-alcohol dehydrogenase-like predicted oxidoreductase